MGLCYRTQHFRSFLYSTCLVYYQCIENHPTCYNEYSVKKNPSHSVVIELNICFARGRIYIQTHITINACSRQQLRAKRQARRMIGCHLLLLGYIYPLIMSLCMCMMKEVHDNHSPPRFKLSFSLQGTYCRGYNGELLLHT